MYGENNLLLVLVLRSTVVEDTSRGGSWTRHFSSKLQNSVTTVQLYQVLVLDLRSLSWNMDGET